jgi:hypothetical protein
MRRRLVRLLIVILILVGGYVAYSNRQDPKLNALRKDPMATFLPKGVSSQEVRFERRSGRSLGKNLPSSH